MKLRKIHLVLFIMSSGILTMVCCNSGNHDNATPRQTDTIYIYSTRTDTIWEHDTITLPPEISKHVEATL